MKIALVGSSSFLAKSIISLWKEKYDLVCIDRAHYSFPESSFRSGFNWNEILQCDIIIHCAASGVLNNTSVSEEEIMQINFHEPIRLINSLEDFQYKGRLITFGSYFSVGEIEERTSPINEEELVLFHKTKKSTYSLSKFRLLEFLSGNQINIKHLHVVLTNVYGGFENESRLMPYIIKSLKNSTSLSFGAGTQFRQFTFVDDIIKGIEMTFSHNVSGIYNLSNPVVQTVRTFIENVLNESSKKYPLTNYEFGAEKRHDATMPYLALNTSKFEDEFGVIEFTPISEAIKSYYK